MSTNPNLQAGQFITTINGKRCTAVPRAVAAASGGGGGGAAGNAATNTPAKQTQARVVEESQAIASSPPAQVIQSSTPEALAPEITSTPLAPVETSTPQEPPPPSSSPAPAIPITDSAPPPTEPTPAAESTANVASQPLPVAPQQTIPQSTIPDTVTPPTSNIASAATPTTFATSTSPAVLAVPILNTSSTEGADNEDEPATAVIANPASKGTTPTISSSTTSGNVLSDVQPSPTTSLTSGADDSFGLQAIPSSMTSISNSSPSELAAEQKSSTSGISSTSYRNTAPVIGGILAGVAIIGIIGVLLWCCRRRRRRRDERSLTPLGPPPGEKSYYEIDHMSVVPSLESVRMKGGFSNQSNKLSGTFVSFKAGIVGIGASLRSKITSERSASPNVNLNRGNSQFLDGPIPQHSRNNSTLSYSPEVTVKDRVESLWGRFRAGFGFQRLRTRSEQDPFADPISNPRGMTERIPPRNTPDVSRLLDINEQLMQIQAKRRSTSLSHPGSLGLNFQSNDPFADPPSFNKAYAPFISKTTNPFADPIRAPQPSIPKGQSYIADIRRSRGQSIDATTSRYPSTIAPSRDSYRDTIVSSFTISTRKGKGHSDPFDLERPDLWKPLQKEPPVPVDKRTSTRNRAASLKHDSTDYNSAQYVNPLRMSSVQPRGVGGREPLSPVSSKYSSGVSSLGGLGDWGDPGPDLGPGSGGNSMRGNVSGYSSMEFGANGVYVNGSLAELVLRREVDNVSPMSVESKGKSVGKAM